jgi:hypothetical protein
MRRTRTCAPAVPARRARHPSLRPGRVRDGAQLAIDFALAYPDLADAIVVVSPGLTGYRWSDAGLQTLVEEVDRAIREGDMARAIDVELAVWAPTSAAIDPRVRQIALDNPHVLRIDDSLMEVRPSARHAAGGSPGRDAGRRGAPGYGRDPRDRRRSRGADPGREQAPGRPGRPARERLEGREVQPAGWTPLVPRLAAPASTWTWGSSSRAAVSSTRWRAGRAWSCTQVCGTSDLGRHFGLLRLPRVVRRRGYGRRQARTRRPYSHATTSWL